MKIVGIIAEYNPLHNGHKYQIDQIKKELNPDYIIVAMGNNFTQRGDCSIIDKFDKAKLALQLGVSLVIEIPTIFSCSSAEYFAFAGVNSLNSLGVVTHLCFGTESDNLEELKEIATILCSEDSTYKKLLKLHLDSGVSYPKARNLALASYLKKDTNDSKFNLLLNSSNNILAIEYLKALEKCNSKMIPYSIKRIGPNENDSTIENNFSSASNIREILKTGLSLNDYTKVLDDIKELVPIETYELLENNLKSGVINPSIDSYSDIFGYILSTITKEKLQLINESREGNYISILKASHSEKEISKILSLAKSKRFTYTSLSRFAIYILLGITKKDFDIAKKVFPRYIRVLGFRNDSKLLLKEIQDTCKLPFVTNFNKFYKDTTNKTIKYLLDNEIKYNNIYHIKRDNDLYSDLKKTIVKI